MNWPSTDPRSATRFRQVFGSRHVVLPVIHVVSAAQAERNVLIAKDSGADGVFLINHSMSARSLLEIHDKMVELFPEWWIGANCLDLHPETVFARVSQSVSGVWVDNAMIHEGSTSQPEAEAVLRAQADGGWRGLYFGGVAFKYQRPVADLAAASRHARQYMDVVTTSGAGTGIAADLNKIRVMKQGSGDFPLAIASGITPENVAEYLPHAECFLVATGVSSSFTELDPYLMSRLIEKVRSFEEPSGGANEDHEPPRYRRVCFVCEWNEGRSVHLELSVRQKLRVAGSTVEVCSAGFRRGGGVNELRRAYLLRLGIPQDEIDRHRSTLFGAEHARCDLILVAEAQMRDRLLVQWPALQGRAMTMRGFALGQSPGSEALTPEGARVEDAAGHDEETKLALYAELEGLAGAIARRLTADR